MNLVHRPCKCNSGQGLRGWEFGSCKVRVVHEEVLAGLRPSQQSGSLKTYLVEVTNGSILYGLRSAAVLFFGVVNSFHPCHSVIVLQPRRSQ